jgi:radical SAM superfamily enzyme YgiQ (UPF0313 family)
VRLLDPDVVGISAWTDWWYPAYHLGELVKKSLPNVHLCYGGPHISIYPEETLSLDHVDSIIVGDGEVPFAFLCNMIGNETLENDVPGLHLKQYGIKRGKDSIFIQRDLDELPIPDRTLLPLRCYTSVLSGSLFATTMITSRGCPYRCTYCKLSFQKTICRSAESVINEFKKIKELGINEVEIYDDTFTTSKQRVKEICNGLIQQQIQLQWAIRDRVNSVDSELLDIMKKAGCTRINYGIESGVDRILKLMRKNITTEQARRAVNLTKEKKFSVLTFFMIGNRGETVQDMRKTIDFALELDADYAEFSITIPYPGTELYQEALSKGIISHDYWKEFALNPIPGFCPPELIEEAATMNDLLKIRNEAVHRFYFRISYMLREVRKVRRWREFHRKVKMGIRLFLSLLGNPIRSEKGMMKQKKQEGVI